MADRQVSRAGEARNLGEDAVAATRQGDGEEGKFLADADEVLKGTGASKA